MASKNLAVLDLETDPFKHGHVVQPFLAGFYDGARQISFWSDDCVAKLVGALEQESKEWVIYAHNGGRFDFFYFLVLSGMLEVAQGDLLDCCHNSCITHKTFINSAK